MTLKKLLITVMAIFGLSTLAYAQGDEGDQPALSSGTFDAFKLRSIGPAFMSGRIADIAIVQDDPATWYVAVGSGGVWKTENAGTTWTSLFDGQGSYSIGSLGLDPSDPSRIWVGTGENHGGRHLGYGDGIYLSEDGGKTWKNMGLKQSERIGKIIVHPDDSNTVWVAAQGPIWSPGGERGVYKTTDGGETWELVLSSDNRYTGAGDLMIDPSNPDRLYATTWQRHRTVAAYVGGGPESGIWRSEDGGETWKELKTGLPKGNMGKIGITISPIQTDVVYAAIETDRREGGIWRSTDRGSSWTKMSDEVSGGTGPHYYQELYASPHYFDRIYLMSNTSMISNDGGKTFAPLNNKNKHVDDHALAFRPDDSEYVLFGSDGGLYESYDHTKTWRYISNLPVTQFYKVAVDDAEPFYTVYGGTQDNNSQGGPSRTDSRHGILNSDWFITLFADGHQSAIEPGNPDIMYAQWQQGNLARVDRITGEVIHIQPQAAPGDPIMRWNWDAPIWVSQHNPTRLYHASQRLWRSDDRGDTWRAISPDLTRDENRLRLPVQGRQWSWDAGWDLLAMSQYNTITSIGESPFDENVLYIGTDDGLIQITEDGGQTWTRVEAGSLPGVPSTAFVNDIRADLHDPNTVYIALDNHKYGDFKPYLLKSTNRGRTWRSITGDMPDRHLIWRIVQDHVTPNLLFTATEFGLFFTVDGGAKWIKMTGDAPTISFRDVTIQRREDDLVGASFGRGFYIVDDISPLREVSEASLRREAMLFPGRDALWYIETGDIGFYQDGGSLGSNLYRAENPPFGANFTYYLADDIQSLKDIRQSQEKPIVKEGGNTPFPSFDSLSRELLEDGPMVWLTVRDLEGNVVRRIKGPTTKGFHRVNWDLRYPSLSAIIDMPGPDNDGSGFLASPGEYTVSLSKRVRGVTTELVAPQRFTVERLRDGALPAQVDAADFWASVSAFSRKVSAVSSTLEATKERVGLMEVAVARASGDPTALENRLAAIRDEVNALDAALNGDQARNEIAERTQPTVLSRLGTVAFGVSTSTYGPTQTHRDQFGYAQAEFTGIRDRLRALTESTIPAFETELEAAGAPWVAGSALPAN